MPRLRTWGVWTLLGWFWALGLALAAPSATPPPTPAWEILRGCRLLPEKTRDGDSFHVVHRGREHIFRLYSVDAPETDTRFPERIADQARHFGIPSDAVPGLGVAAGEFTARFLARGFTVVTRWENGLGLGRSPRFYGVVLVGNTNLATELVRHGLARRQGVHARWPNVEAHARFLDELKQADAEARRLRRGGFSPRWQDPKASGRNRVDLNAASTAELETLPGIGPALAKRIVAARPFRAVQDLRDVPGIGPKTYAGLTNRVVVGSPPRRRQGR